MAEMAPFTCTFPLVSIHPPLFHAHCAIARYFGRLPEASVQRVVVPEETAAVFLTVRRTMATLPQHAYWAVVTSQPDAAVAGALSNIGGEIEISQFPDSFPALAVAAAAAPATTRFSGTRRLRIKESDRVAAMADVLARLGVESDAGENSFVVHGTGSLFNGGAFSSFGDHRIAMATAIAATRASSPVEIDDTACAAKSYPGFFAQFAALGRIG